MELLYTIDAGADEPIMLIDKHIGYDEDDGYGIMGDLFARELLYLDTLGKKRIQVWINSGGGSVIDGYAIYNAILKSVTKVDTYVSGMCASIAAVIFQAGRRRYMADYGILMYHNPFGSDNTKLLDAMRSSLLTMICGRCNMSEADMSRMMARTTYIDATEALQLHLCDEIEQSVDLNKKRLVPVMNGDDTKAFWKESNLILNSLFNKPNIKQMKQVTNRLRLTDDASETSIVSAIEDIQNKNTQYAADIAALNKKSKEEMDTMQNKIKETEDALNAMKKDFEDCKNELEEVKKEKEDGENATKKEKAKNLINAYVVSGRIAKDDAAEWEADAVENFEKIKNRLEKMPVNRGAVKFDTTSKNPQTQFANIVAGGTARDMANIQNKLKK